MGMFLRRSKNARDPLAVAMSGVRLGERVLQIGADDSRLVGQIAAKTGLSGSAACVARNADEAASAKAAADRAGVLVDIQVVPSGPWPHADGAFDVAVIHSAAGMLASLDATSRQGLFAESARVLRPGGRLIAIEPGAKSGLRAVLRPAPAAQAAYDAGGGVLADLRAAGFAAVRTLGDREGLRFTEGLKSGAGAQ